MTLEDTKLRSTIRKKILELDDAQTFLDCCKYHMENMQIFCENNIKSRRQFTLILMSKYFFDYLETYDRKPCSEIINKEFYAPIIPFIGCLSNSLSPNLIRKRMINFLEYITVGDVLLCTMIGSTEQEYELRILAKYGDYRKIDDLGFHAYLLKSPEEMQILGQELKESTVIRGVVTNVFIKDVKITISVKDTTVSKKKVPVKLGHVTEEYSRLLSLKSNIGSSTNFHICAKNANVLHSVHSKLNEKMAKEPCSAKSHCRKFHKNQYDNTISGKEIIRQMKNRYSNSCLELASLLYEKKDFSGATEYFNKSLEANPENSKAYLKRGNMYYDMSLKQSVLDQRAVLDWQRALKIGELCPQDFENYIRILLPSAFKYMKDKNFDIAQEIVNIVLHIEKDNKLALNIQKKLNSCNELKSLVDQPLDTLEARKQELVKKLGSMVD